MGSGDTMTLTNCTFSYNSADRSGGGMYTGNDSAPTLTNCAFSHNSAGFGGGMYGGAFNSMTLTNCTFSGNSAGQTGGSLHSGDYSNPTLTNCTLTGNSTNGFGGGVHSTFEAILTVESCILWRNVDDAGGSEGGPFADESAQIHIEGGSAAVHYTSIQGLISGGDFDDGTNIGSAPLFVPGPAGCYYLSQIAAGQAVDSPCVDSGDPSSPPLGGTTRSDEDPDTGIVDMGYHYPVTDLPLMMGDFNRDLDVDLADFRELQGCFTGVGPVDVSPCCRIFDLEPDNDVDLDDYAAFHAVMTGP